MSPFETYTRSIPCLVMIDEPTWERIAAAFEAGRAIGAAMSDERTYEIEIRVRDAQEETVKYLEGPLPHKTVEDVAVDMANLLNTRSGAKVHEINAAR